VINMRRFHLAALVGLCLSVALAPRIATARSSFGVSLSLSSDVFIDAPFSAAYHYYNYYDPGDWYDNHYYYPIREHRIVYVDDYYERPVYYRSSYVTEYPYSDLVIVNRYYTHPVRFHCNDYWYYRGHHTNWYIGGAFYLRDRDNWYHHRDREDWRRRDWHDNGRHNGWDRGNHYGWDRGKGKDKDWKRGDGRDDSHRDRDYSNYRDRDYSNYRGRDDDRDRGGRGERSGFRSREVRRESFGSREEYRERGGRDNAIHRESVVRGGGPEKHMERGGGRPDMGRGRSDDRGRPDKDRGRSDERGGGRGKKSGR
jgi:hypothetical protein